MTKPSTTRRHPSRRAQPLTRAFYARDTLTVARALLGCVLEFACTRGVRRGRIVETEAYRGLDDRASHAFAGSTPRSAIMFGPPGMAYVYLIYGMYHCLNVVTEPKDVPAAVLIRAVEPLDAMAEANASGPGRLCRAFGISREQNGADLTRSKLRIVAGSAPARIATSTRVGVAYAGASAELPWRFYDASSRHVSRPRVVLP